MLQLGRVGGGVRAEEAAQLTEQLLHLLRRLQLHVAHNVEAAGCIWSWKLARLHLKSGARRLVSVRRNVDAQPSLPTL